eukprot:364337-Chlamydomonas_euryale.AAC.7
MICRGKPGKERQGALLLHGNASLVANFRRNPPYLLPSPQNTLPSATPRPPPVPPPSMRAPSITELCCVPHLGARRAAQGPAHPSRCRSPVP